MSGSSHLLGTGKGIAPDDRTGSDFFHDFLGSARCGKDDPGSDYRADRPKSAVHRPFAAVTSGIKEITRGDGGGGAKPAASDRRTIVFVDEIHRFNKAQQDAFLPYRGKREHYP